MGRISPKERRMTRGDSLASIQKYGEVVPISKQRTMEKAKEMEAKRKGGGFNPLRKLVSTIKGKKK